MFNSCHWCFLGLTLSFILSSLFPFAGGLIHIVTGPNNSGKSVYLKQVGLIVYMAHCGLVSVICFSLGKTALAAVYFSSFAPLASDAFLILDESYFLHHRDVQFVPAESAVIGLRDRLFSVLKNTKWVQ